MIHYIQNWDPIGALILNGVKLEVLNNFCPLFAVDLGHYNLVFVSLVSCVQIVDVPILALVQPLFSHTYSILIFDAREFIFAVNPIQVYLTGPRVEGVDQ